MEQLTKQLKSGQLDRLYLLFGEEDYLIHFYANRLVDKSVSEEDRLMNLCILEGAEATADRIRESVETYPFLGEKRVTWVKNSEWFSSKKGDPQGADKLLSVIKDIPSSSLLLFQEKQVDKRTGLYKAAGRAGSCVELSQPDEEGMIRFVARELAKEDKVLSRETARYFLQTVGGDMMYQQLELAKLAAYKGDEKVVEERDVDAVCTPQPESDVFRMTDALGNRSRKEALKIYERLLDNNEAPQRIFYLLCQQIRRLYRAALCREKKLPREELSRIVGVSPRAVWIYEKQSARFGTEQLERLLEDLTETDEKIKTGQLDAQDGIERLVASI